MKTRLSLAPLPGLAIVAVLLGGCAHVALPHLAVTHVPPGQSLNVALAKKPELVSLPAAPKPAVAAVATQVPAVEPDLPKSDNAARAAEAYSRGEFCMNAGNDSEAITAFEDVVRIDPMFSEAWTHLAALYEKKGDNKKAIEAFRRSKKIAAQ